MQNGLTDDDRQHISAFLAASKYERTPELLTPEQDEEEETD